ncbi:MAG: class II aldolase/adducin family protein [Firmicutes bacterium]|nr:class II aldolase/adducin family protein [Bacillota bacterium]
MNFSGSFDKNTIGRLVEKSLTKLGEKASPELCFYVGSVVEKLLEEMEADKVKEEMVCAGRHFYNMGFMAGASGNISVRTGSDSILITPSGLNKGSMSSADMLKVNLQGEVIEESVRKPSSEMKMHLASYRHRPDIGAIIHSHPPFATSFAAAGLALDMPVLPEAILILGSVPIVEYGMPSTDEVPEKLIPWLPDHNVFLLANHGALVFGADLKEASHRMETLELYAKVILMARMLGGEKLLSAENLERLKNAFNIR